MKVEAIVTPDNLMRLMREIKTLNVPYTGIISIVAFQSTEGDLRFEMDIDILGILGDEDGRTICDVSTSGRSLSAQTYPRLSSAPISRTQPTFPWHSCRADTSSS